MISPPLSKNDIALAKNEIHLIKTPGKMQIAVQAFAWLLSYEVVGTSAPPQWLRTVSFKEVRRVQVLFPSYTLFFCFIHFHLHFPFLFIYFLFPFSQLLFRFFSLLFIYLFKDAYPIGIAQSLGVRAMKVSEPYPWLKIFFFLLVIFLSFPHLPNHLWHSMNR